MPTHRLLQPWRTPCFTAQCFHVFCLSIRIRTDYFPKHHLSLSPFNGHGLGSLRGRNWSIKYNRDECPSPKDLPVSVCSMIAHLFMFSVRYVLRIFSLYHPWRSTYPNATSFLTHTHTHTHTHYIYIYILVICTIKSNAAVCRGIWNYTNSDNTGSCEIWSSFHVLQCVPIKYNSMIVMAVMRVRKHNIFHSKLWDLHSLEKTWYNIR
jgi:hypothetical protein